MSSSAPPPVEPQEPAKPAPPPASRPLVDAARVLLKGGAVLAASLAAVAAIFYFVPESNDYARISVRKHERLARYEVPKIVLVGGSNLAFGIDSAMIARQTGCPVINMGMNGYYGVRYMLEEVKSELNPSDFVVVAFEYDNYYKSVDGSPTDLLAVVKANPQAFSHLSLQQQGDVLSTVPLAAQRKAMRLMEGAFVWAKDRVLGRPRAGTDQESALIGGIESVAGFTPEGDLVSHLGVHWPFELTPGNIPPGAPIDPQVIGLIQDYARDLEARGVQVMVSYTPVERAFYDAHAQDLATLHERISAAAPLDAPSPPSAYMFDRTYFFDTVYHLNAEGRELRTQQLINDMERHLHGASMCTQTAARAGE